MLRVFEVQGLREAVEKETSLRDLAFLEPSEMVCGVACEPMTVRHLLLLDGIGSPFVTHHRQPTSEDVILFLWALQPVRRRTRFGLFCFAFRHRKLKHADSVAAIKAHVRETMMDSPPHTGSLIHRSSYYSTAASVVDLFASQYGWSEQAVLNISIKRLFQYRRCMSLRNGSRAPMFNLFSDEVKRNFAANLKGKSDGLH